MPVESGSSSAIDMYFPMFRFARGITPQYRKPLAHHKWLIDAQLQQGQTDLGITKFLCLNVCDTFRSRAARGIPLQVGALANQDVKLTIGGSTSLDVVADPPPVETTRAQQANVIEQRAITERPIDRRDYLTFSLAPGISDSKALADSNSFRVKQTIC